MIRSRAVARAALCAALLALGACREMAEPLPPVGEDRVTAQEAACIADGGRWGEGARPGILVCYRTTPDAGRQCLKGSDCEGFCLARSKTCAPVTPLYGCNDVLGATGARSTVCTE